MNPRLFPAAAVFNTGLNNFTLTNKQKKCIKIKVKFEYQLFFDRRTSGRRDVRWTVSSRSFSESRPEMSVLELSNRLILIIGSDYISIERIV